MKRIILIASILLTAISVSAQEGIKPLRVEAAAMVDVGYGVDVEYAIPFNSMTISPSINISLFGVAVGTRLYLLNSLGTGLYVKCMNEYFFIFGENYRRGTGIGVLANVGYRLHFLKVLTGFIDLGISYSNVASGQDYVFGINYALGIGLAL